MSNKLIDKLLNDRREFGDVWIADEDAKAMAAALKAGQAVIDAIDRGNVKTLELETAIQAWDALTREGEV